MGDCWDVTVFSSVIFLGGRAARKGLTIGLGFYGEGSFYDEGSS